MPEFNQGRGRKLRTALFLLDITQKQCAEDIGRSAQYVTEVVNDIRQSTPVVNQVARYVLEHARSLDRQDVIDLIDWSDELEAADDDSIVPASGEAA